MMRPSLGRNRVLVAGFEGDPGLKVIAEHLGGDILHNGELGQA